MIIKINVSITSIEMIDYSEIRYLPTFLAVCDEGGFHRAAEKLNLSQPAISYQIAMLEQTLGVPLFERVGRGVIPTEPGRTLHEFCRRTLGDFDILRERLRSGELGFASTLRVASVSGFGRYVLFPLLSEHFADVRIELRFPTQEEVLRQVATGACDVGIIYEPIVSNLFHCEVLTEEELVLVRGGIRTGSIRRIGDLADLPFVTYDEGDYVFGRWMRGCFGETIDVHSVAHFEELEEVVDFVRRGLGLSILPEHCARREIEDGTIRIVRTRPRRRAINIIYSVRRSGSRGSPEVQRLLELVPEAV